MAMFKGFKPQAVEKIANKMGYQGSMQNFDNYLQQNPDKQREMIVYEQQAIKMARGGVLDGVTLRPTYGANTIADLGSEVSGVQTMPESNFKGLANLSNQPQIPTTGGQVQPRQLSQTYTPDAKSTKGKKITDVTVDRLTDPGLPTGAKVIPVGTKIEKGQTIAKGTGEVTGDVVAGTTKAGVEKADTITDEDRKKEIEATKTVKSDAVSEKIGNVVDAVTAQTTSPDDPRAKITAQTATSSLVGDDLEAEQGKITKLENPVQREIQAGELISGVANAEKAAKFTEQIQAAETKPSEEATVQGQLAKLTDNFDATNPPAWAAGALRGVQAAMAQRGLGASSMAGQAMIQAALESALPIASADAQTVASFEAQNLSNRQQRAMLAAQQRATFMGQEFDQAFQARVQNASKISDIANMNFTADQQIALENSRAANTMNLTNLSNKQAMVMAEVSAIANMDMANLSNSQQAAVQNAQNFLQREMTDVSNKQQAELFKAQQRTQALFTDQAQEFAAQQFNATSQNQTNQFFANLGQQASQFNASQYNAQQQFNAGQENAQERFNAEIDNQRDQFNAQNQLVIAQNNAQWRRQVATADTAAVNRANEINANAVLDISKQAYDNLWNYYGDTMKYAWESAENELDRYVTMATAELNAETQKEIQSMASGSTAGKSIGSLIGTLGSAFISAKLCWVAREVYGTSNPKWFVFRTWLRYDAPKWFVNIYNKHGEKYAKFISNKPLLKFITKKIMDYLIKEKRNITYDINKSVNTSI